MTVEVQKFPNLAGQANIDDGLACELEEAGITVKRLECLRDEHPEVNTAVRGELEMWGFHRNWYYWVAKGPGIPPKYANALHEQLGSEVRVEGHCGCPSPLEWRRGFAIGSYHVDTQRGLNALANTIRAVVKDAALEPKEQNDAVDTH